MVAIRESLSAPNPIDYLRISLIDRCNFQCVYCMPEGADLQYALKENWLTHDEILLLLKEVFIPVGFTRFRLTGGEPLLRPGIVELVDAIAHLPLILRVSFVFKFCFIFVFFFNGTATTEIYTLSLHDALPISL